MCDWEYGMIFNMLLLVGKKMFVNYVVYVVFKFGVYGLFEIFCEENVLKNVCVMLVVFGVVEIELLIYVISKLVLFDYEVWKVFMGGLILDFKYVVVMVKFMYDML